MTGGIGYAVHAGQAGVVLNVNNRAYDVQDINAWLSKWAGTVMPLSYAVLATYMDNPSADALQQHIKKNVIMLNLEPMPEAPNGWFLASIGEQARDRSFPTNSCTYQRDLNAETYINVSFQTKDGKQISGCLFATSDDVVKENKRIYNEVRHIRLTQQEAMELLEKQKKPGAMQYGRIMKILLEETGEVIDLPASRLIWQHQFTFLYIIIILSSGHVASNCLYFSFKVYVAVEVASDIQIETCAFQTLCQCEKRIHRMHLDDFTHMLILSESVSCCQIIQYSS